MCRFCLFTSFALVAVVTNAIAKPPETTPCPETEFKVLSPMAQEYHQPDEAHPVNVFVPTTEWAPVTTAAKKAAESIVDSLTSVEKWASVVFEMAEIHRLAGDWDEACRWYAGIQKLYPQTTYALQAAAQLERHRLLLVSAMAEKITVMPRESRASGVGSLRETSFAIDGKSAYAFTNSSGRLTFYVTAATGVDLSDYIRRQVQLFGNVERRGDVRGVEYMVVTEVKVEKSNPGIANNTVPRP